MLASRHGPRNIEEKATKLSPVRIIPRGGVAARTKSEPRFNHFVSTLIGPWRHAVDGPMNIKRMEALAGLASFATLNASYI